MTLEEKEELLLKATYNSSDIKKLTNYEIKRTRVSQIMNECKTKFNGAVLYRPNVITSKSYWAREGTTIEQEYYLLGIAKGNIKHE